MIYIVTPYMSEFHRICSDNKLPYSNGRSSHDVKWVNHVCQLFGIAIYPSDTIIKGEQYYCFDTAMLDAIEKELAIRQHYGRMTQNAIQKQSSNAGNVCQPTKDRKTMGKGNSKHKSTTRKIKEKEN